MKIHFINVGLPKCGTSYLQGLVSQIENISTGKIKEPTYVDLSDSEYINSKYLDNVIAAGNYSKGIDWYKELYDNFDITFDFSTQYWIKEPLRHEADLKIVKFAIFRDPVSQIKSYISHLRRGYLPDLSLDELFDNDPVFKKYIENMYDYGKKLENNDSDILILDFNELVSNPQLVIDKMISSYVPKYKPKKLNLKVHENKKGSPKIKFLNKIIMSRGLNKFLKKITPDIIYSYMINLRKLIINTNLNTNKVSSFNKDDIKIIEELFE